MVAAAKYARAERELKPARVYGTGSLGKRTVWLAFVSSHRGGGSEYLTRTHLHGALWGQGLVGPLKLSWLLSAPWKELRSAVCDTPCGLVPSAKPWRDAVGWGGRGVWPSHGGQEHSVQTSAVNRAVFAFNLKKISRVFICVLMCLCIRCELSRAVVFLCSYFSNTHVPC